MSVHLHLRLGQLLDETPDVDRTVADDDAMFRGDWHKYELAGRTAMRAIHLGLVQAGVGPVRRILDLPCGHGRILRHLKVGFPDAELVACDIDRSGVAWCERQFGARGVVSEPDPARIALPGDFDLIWCGSLLTHIPIPLWTAWIGAFERWLRPGGVVLFSVHGREPMRRIVEQGTEYSVGAAGAAQLVADTRRQGWGFQSYGEDPDYGVTLTDGGWVVGQLLERRTLQLVSYSEVALNRHQDIVTCRRFG